MTTSIRKKSISKAKALKDETRKPSSASGYYSPIQPHIKQETFIKLEPGLLNNQARSIKQKPIIKQEPIHRQMPSNNQKPVINPEPVTKQKSNNGTGGGKIKAKYSRCRRRSMHCKTKTNKPYNKPTKSESGEIDDSVKKQIHSETQSKASKKVTFVLKVGEKKKEKNEDVGCNDVQVITKEQYTTALNSLPNKQKIYDTPLMNGKLEPLSVDHDFIIKNEIIPMEQKLAHVDSELSKEDSKQPVFFNKEDCTTQSDDDSLSYSEQIIDLTGLDK